MFKRNKDLFWAAIGLCLFALFVFTLNRLKQPREVILDLGVEKELSQQHRFIETSLGNAEELAKAEDAALVSVKPPVLPAANARPVEGAPLPVAWASKPAPEASEVKLSASLQRSLAASADLRSEQYTDPSSELNLQRVHSLRQIREKRQQ